MASKRYDAIDLCKFICSLLVVLIHANTTANSFSNFFVASFTNQAVPFFFIVSGFFYTKKLLACQSANESKLVMVKYVKKNFLLYLAWQLAWIGYILRDYLRIYDGQNPVKILFVLIRRLFLAGNGVYWYVLVCAEAAVIIYCLNKYKLKKLIYILVIIGLALNTIYICFGQTDVFIFRLIYKAFYYVFSWNNNVIMVGFPFMAIGYAFASGDLNLKNKTSVFVIVASNILNPLIYILLTYFQVENAGSYCLFFIFQAVSMFALAVNSTLNFEKSIVLRGMSNSIYFLHTIFIYLIMDKYMKFMPNPFLKAALAIVLSIGVYAFTQKTKLRPLKYLLSV